VRTPAPVSREVEVSILGPHADQWLTYRAINWQKGRDILNAVDSCLRMDDSRPYLRPGIVHSQTIHQHSIFRR